tara:strand:+ start:198 stop:500 length:303 start_codon:yes stop_codon:yes gene_type:complete
MSENNLDIRDISTFNQNYSKMKKDYKTRPYLTKYQKTQIISERSQQLANGALSLLENPEAYPSVYEIALEELKQKKIPFIIGIPISGKIEYWKIHDLESF